MTNTENVQTPLKQWVEPEVRSLDVHETAVFPKVGNDNPVHDITSKS